MNQKLKKNKKFMTVYTNTNFQKKLKKESKEKDSSLYQLRHHLLKERRAGEHKETEESCTKEDEEKIKARLRALGYID